MAWIAKLYRDRSSKLTSGSKGTLKERQGGGMPGSGIVVVVILRVGLTRGVTPGSYPVVSSERADRIRWYLVCDLKLTYYGTYCESGPFPDQSSP